MAIIQKRADELKPGDVVYIDGKGTCSYLYASRTEFEDTCWAIFGKHSNGNHYKREVSAHDMFEVTVPDLTPAQQHADELAISLESVLSIHAGKDERDFARQLLNKIKPPEPPTLAEALALVEDLAGGHSIDRVKKARELLDRARRVNLLK